MAANDSPGPGAGLDGVLFQCDPGREPDGGRRQRGDREPGAASGTRGLGVRTHRAGASGWRKWEGGATSRRGWAQTSRTVRTGQAAGREPGDEAGAGFTTKAQRARGTIGNPSVDCMSRRRVRSAMTCHWTELLVAWLVGAVHRFASFCVFRGPRRRIPARFATGGSRSRDDSAEAWSGRSRLLESCRWLVARVRDAETSRRVELVVPLAFGAVHRLASF